MTIVGTLLVSLLMHLTGEVYWYKYAGVWVAMMAGFTARFNIPYRVRTGKWW